MIGLDFIKSGKNQSDVTTAQRQQKQLDYFVVSDIQEDISINYLNNWIENKFISNDSFLNFVKTVFKEDNFKSFFSYLRKPLASSSLIREEVIPELQRVFHADDSFTEYSIGGVKNKSLDGMDIAYLRDKVFNQLMYNHNAIVVTRLNEAQVLIHDFISIKDVVSINCEYNKINKLAYYGIMQDESGQDVNGVIYIDGKVFEFYELEAVHKEMPPLYTWSHGQDFVPADFVSPKPFYEKKAFAVRYSVFSGVREDLEEYVFLKTIQRMTEPNGAIPITVKLKTNEVKENGQAVSAERTADGMPLSANIVGGQKSTFNKEVASKGSVLQAGTIIEVPIVKKDDQSLDMDAVQNFLKFYYIPTEALEYLNTRIQEIHKTIIRKVVGDYAEANEAAKNQKQVEKSFIGKQDKLRSLSEQLSKVMTSIETKSIKFMHGVNSYAEVFFGSDFFVETKLEVYEMIEKAPNAIQRRNLLARLAGIDNKGNATNMQRDKILNMLIPYATDLDFDKAIARGGMPNELFELQTRFGYWISLFEATYGSIVFFWENLGEEKDNVKLITIHNLLIDLIVNSLTLNKIENEQDSEITVV